MNNAKKREVMIPEDAILQHFFSFRVRGIQQPIIQNLVHLENRAFCNKNRISVLQTTRTFAFQNSSVADRIYMIQVIDSRRTDAAE